MFGYPKRSNYLQTLCSVRPAPPHPQNLKLKLPMLIYVFKFFPPSHTPCALETPPPALRTSRYLKRVRETEDCSPFAACDVHLTSFWAPAVKEQSTGSPVGRCWTSNSKGCRRVEGIRAKWAVKGLEHLEVETGRATLLFTYRHASECVKDRVAQSIIVRYIQLLQLRTLWDYGLFPFLRKSSIYTWKPCEYSATSLISTNLHTVRKYAHGCETATEIDLPYQFSCKRVICLVSEMWEMTTREHCWFCQMVYNLKSYFRLRLWK